MKAPSPTDPQAALDAACEEVFGDKAQAEAANEFVKQSAKERSNAAKARVHARPQNEKTRVWSRPELCDEWVWVANAKRFIKRDDLDLMWDKETFDDAFGYCKPKGVSRLSQALFSASKDTIRKPLNMVYRPGAPEFTADGTLFNMYRPSDIVPAEGDTTIWREHFAYLFPTKDDHDLVLNWIAWLLQNIGLKPKHALLIQGTKQGTGKSYIAEVLERILGIHNVSPVDESELASEFNSFAMRCKLVLIEELRALDRGIVKKKLHPLITQERIRVNDKNIKRFLIDNVFGIFGMTNDDAAVVIEDSDRRYAVARTEVLPREPAYYDRLYASLKDPVFIAAVAWELLHRDVGAYNGAGRAPETAAKRDMIYEGKDDITRYIIDEIRNPPFCWRLVSVNRDIIPNLPKRMQNRNGIDKAVIKAIKSACGGMSLGQFRVQGGEFTRIWSLHGNGEADAKRSRGEIVATYMRQELVGAPSSGGPAVNDNVIDFPVAANGNPWD